MIWHVFTVHDAEMEDICPFFGVIVGYFFFLVKKEDMSSKKRMYGNPNLCTAAATSVIDLMCLFLYEEGISYITLFTSLVYRLRASAW